MLLDELHWEDDGDCDTARVGNYTIRYWNRTSILDPSQYAVWPHYDIYSNDYGKEEQWLILGKLEAQCVLFHITGEGDVTGRVT